MMKFQVRHLLNFLAFALFNGISAFFSPLYGWIADKYGLKETAKWGSFLGFFGIYFASQFHHQELFVLFLLFGGIFVGAITFSGNISVGYYFEERR
jgi:MFS family permease